MEATLLHSKGCVYRVELNPSSKQFWTVKPAINAGAPILFRDSRITKADAFATALAFNDIRVVAPTTKNFAKLSLSGIALLGSNTKNSFVTPFTQWFDKNRARSLGKPIQVSAKNGQAFNVLLESMNIGPINPELHIISFDINGYIIND